MTSDSGPAPRFVMDECPADERQRAEAIIRTCLNERSPGESWLISLHRFHDGWDVFIDGPDSDARTALTEALGQAGFRR